MKTVIIILILLAAGAAGYALISPPREEGLKEVMNPAPVTPPHEEGLGEVSPPAGTPVPDNPDDIDPAPAKVFDLTGKNFSFSQTEIRVKKGDRVIINFESTDGFHDWVVDEFNAQTQRVNPGTQTSVEFIASKTGTFEYYCSVSIHRAAGMKGQMIVE